MNSTGSNGNVCELGKFVRQELGSQVAAATSSCVICKVPFKEISLMAGEKYEVKVLRCLHSVCGMCLQDSLSKGKGLTCSLCDARFEEENYDKYLCNFVENQRLDHRAVEASLQSPEAQFFKCDECIDALPAVHYCVQCARRLCVECGDHHKRSKTTAGHPLCALSDTGKQKAHRLHRVALCPVHANCELEFFCETCSVMCCRVCIREGHENHTYKLPSEGLVVKQRQQLQDHVQQLRNLGVALQERHQQLTNNIEDFEKKLNASSQNILHLEQQVKAALNDRRIQMLKEVETFRESQQEEYEAQRATLASSMLTRWRAIDFLEKVLTRGTNCEVLLLTGYIAQQKLGEDVLASKVAELAQAAAEPQIPVSWSGDVAAAARAITTMAGTKQGKRSEVLASPSVKSDTLNLSEPMKIDRSVSMPTVLDQIGVLNATGASVLLSKSSPNLCPRPGSGCEDDPLMVLEAFDGVDAYTLPTSVAAHAAAPAVAHAAASAAALLPLKAQVSGAKDEAPKATGAALEPKEVAEACGGQGASADVEKPPLSMHGTSARKRTPSVKKSARKVLCLSEAVPASGSAPPKNACNPLASQGPTPISLSEALQAEQPKKAAPQASIKRLGASNLHAKKDEELVEGGLGGLRAVLGMEGDELGSFRSPCGMAVDSKRIYIADTLNHRIQVFDKFTLQVLGKVALPANNQVNSFNDPSGMCCMEANGIVTLIVVEYGIDRLLSVRLHIDSLEAISVQELAPQTFYGPFGVGYSQGRIVVADSCNHRCIVLSLNGEVLFTFGCRGCREGEFEYPECLATFSDGSIAVSDKDNHRIQVFDTHGRFLHFIPDNWSPEQTAEKGVKSGVLSVPMGMVVDRQDRIYVADCGSDSVQIFTQKGKWLWSSCIPAAASRGEFIFKSPTAMAADDQGMVFVASDHCVQVF
eukprot:TRINITY_DN35587_c0_g1_i1.p1 TRINITY_DN35587_c0_g1~~TRINITY_DN35587_c0_g1_i1.p1  ORF type:complete len:927 (+),score=206.42 TRINITY_DN35587_c0_g1_i1:47-2827(+)